jgi:uncharacterized DUF497 family protein
MEFEWDETKRRSNFDKHGVDLFEAALIFEGPITTREDRRHDYGERRFVSVGIVGDACFVVVYTRRGGKVRLISAWKGGRHEKERYEDDLSRGNPGRERPW